MTKEQEYQKAYHKVWYAKNRKAVIARVARNKAANREEFAVFKRTLCCGICGETDWRCLDFHHRDAKDKEYSISTMISMGLSAQRIKEELVKCDVVCANCHRKIHREY